MAFKPLGNRVLIKREEQSNTTASGIIIPDSAKEKPFQGEVIAVGQEAKEDGINEGDIVVFGKYKITEITVDNEDLLILNSEDIYGILD